MKHTNSGEKEKVKKEELCSSEDSTSKIWLGPASRSDAKENLKDEL